MARNLKELTVLVLSSMLMLSFLVPTAETRAANGSNITAVWANEGGDKVTRDELRASSNPGNVLNRVWDGTKVALFGAKNEVVAFNLILEASSSGATDIAISFNSLTGPNGASIHSSATSGDGVFDWTNRDIELFYVRYLQIKGLSALSYEFYDERHIPQRLRRPWTGEGEGAGTWLDRPDHDKFYPEIAVPLELVTRFDIAAGQNQSIWVDIYIPKNIQTGLYSGTVTVSENGTVTYQIPVELTVRDFTLPDVPNAKTMIDLSYENINLRYLDEQDTEPGTQNAAASKLIRDRHFQVAHRHRLSLIEWYEQETGWPWELDQPREEYISRLDGSLFTAAHGYDGPGVNTGENVYSIGTYGNWDWQDEGEAAMRLHTNAWVDWFEANSPETEYFLYLIDESEDFSRTEQWSNWINTNPGSGSRLMSMATLSLLDAAAHTPNLDIPTSWDTIGITEDWQSAADIYRADPDKRLFLYNGVRPGSGSFATEDDGVALRELAWGHYKKKIDRWFFWACTYYNNYQGGMGQINVFQTAQTFGEHSGFDNVVGETGWNYSNGDGVLFYPGTDFVYPEESYGVKGPFASLRLKHWRRGIQDVDYLVMASGIDPVRVQQIVDEMIPKVLWDYGVTDPSDPTYVLTDISWPTDPDRWEEARAELADIIERGTSEVPNGNGDDSTVSNGDGGGGGGCFIAIAVYCSPMGDEVVALRKFRDYVLLRNFLGRTFIKFCYEISQPLANSIRNHQISRIATRLSLTPVIYGAKYTKTFVLIFLLSAVAIPLSLRVRISKRF
jgi:hypothetical protein